MAETFDRAEFEHVVTRLQDGVIARRQLRELGADDHDIARMVRRHELTAAQRGVYVTHNGPLTWEQRAWVAVLACWPAALSHRSALPRPPRDGPIHVAVDDRRTVRAPTGLVVHRMANFQARVRWLAAPPRVRLEEAAIDVALGKRSTADRFQVFADACQTRETSAQLVRLALDGRQRVPGREILRDLLTDLANGACSVLEREYLDLERRHGLPSPDRQRPDVVGGKKAYRDVPYAEFALMIELDGGAFHDNAAARTRDAQRDLDTRFEIEATTVRLTYGQVFDHGCETIRKVATLLERRGWAGPFLRCESCSDEVQEPSEDLHPSAPGGGPVDGTALRLASAP